MAEIQDKKFEELGLQKTVSSEKVVSYHRDVDKGSIDNPILVILHGYPESAYKWRHLVPLLPNKPLYIPDLPGYGSSAPAEKHDKVTIGNRIIKALKELLGDRNPPIVLIGHDRGARVAHALHVSVGKSGVQGLQILGLALLDIVPTLSQWETGSTAAAATGWFHWSFLANAHIAKPMITAYGGGKWCVDMIHRWAGNNEKGLEKLKSDNALEVYSTFFNDESVIEASTRDYEAGATSDVDAETKAINEGRAILVPLLLVYSGEFLPKRAVKPILDVWSHPWSDRSTNITTKPIGNGIGHFVAEEAPEQTAEAILDWLPSLGK